MVRTVIIYVLQLISLLQNILKVAVEKDQNSEIPTMSLEKILHRYKNNNLTES